MINIFPEMTQKGKPVNKALCLAIAAILGLASCSAERVSNFPSYKLKIEFKVTSSILAPWFPCAKE